jgi:hypothetical protein
MTFALALTAAIASGLALVLHVVAPKTKNTVDDKLVALLDGLIGKLK